MDIGELAPCIDASDALASMLQYGYFLMRTTLDIDDSVLSAIKELAQRQGKTAGEVISTLARQALLQGSTPQPRQDHVIKEPQASFGFRPLSATSDTLVSNATVDKLRDELGV